VNQVALNPSYVLVLASAIFLLLIPTAVLGSYGILILYYGRKRVHSKKENQAYLQETNEPKVSIVIPTHNEEDVIAAKIKNLLESSYPREKLQIIIVDDSTDSTPDIVRAYHETVPQIELLRFDRRIGYSRSLIAGCQAARGEIIVLSEASSLMDPSTIPLLVSNFEDPTVGVVTGKSTILNLDENLGRLEGSYLRILDFVRDAESEMHSTVYMKGEAAAVRGDLVKDSTDLKDCPGTADTGIAFHVAKIGFRAIYDRRVKFYEYAPSTRKGRVQQKVTRGANLIKILWQFRGMFFRKRYGKFGLIILPMNFAMLTLVPISLLFGALFLCLLTMTNPIASLPIWIVICSVAFAMFLYSRTILPMLLEFEYSLLRAIYEILFLEKTHDMIEKVNSTRRIAGERSLHGLGGAN